MNSLHPGMLCAKFDWNWPSGSGFFNAFLLFYYHVPMEVDSVLVLNKLKSPLLKLSVSSLVVVQWFWRRRCKCEKFTTKWRQQTTDKFRSEKFNWKFDSCELIHQSLYAWIYMEPFDYSFVFSGRLFTLFVNGWSSIRGKDRVSTACSPNTQENHNFMYSFNSVII